MKWAGGWIYGEDWTQAAFGNVDARLTHFPATRGFFCDTLAAGRFRGLAGAALGCDAPNVTAPALPPSLDSPAYDRLVLLGNNRCARARGAEPEGGDAIVQSECAQLAASGQARFRIAEPAGAARIWSDWSWQCWSAEGDQIVQRPCADVPSQAFEVEPVSQTGSSRDVRLVANGGRCVTAGEGAALESALGLAACSASELQVFRL